MLFNRLHIRHSFGSAFRVSPLNKYSQRFYSNKGNQWFQNRDKDLTHFNSSNRSSGSGGNPFFNFFRNIPFSKVIFFVGLPTVTYYFYHLEKVPISNRTRMMDVSKKTEMNLGEQTWQIIKYNYSKQFLPPNHPTSLVVKRISQRLIQVSGLKDLDWQFVVIDSPEANAFVIPNGKVCVFTGLFEIVKDEDQLATVLSHEIAHVIARHSAENWSLTRILMMINFAFSLVFQINPNTILRPALMLGISLPKSRAAEAEADHIGLHLMAKACYHPNAALNLWDNFEKAEKYKTANSPYLSTHPSHKDRKKNIEGWLPEANLIRSRSGCDDLETQLGAFRNRQQ